MTFQPSLGRRSWGDEVEVEVEVEEDAENANYKDGGEDSDLHDVNDARKKCEEKQQN